MSYTPLPISEKAPIVVKNFISKQLDMQFADIHCMLRLPIHISDLHSGLNFATANSLLSIACGISALLTPNIDTSGQSGPRFKEVLKKYYPWDLQPPQGKDIKTAIDDLYKYLRNPLAHSLGLREAGNFWVFIVKDPLTEEEIIKIELQESAPYSALVYSPETLKGEEIERIELYVSAFYWGVRKMVFRLTEDDEQMALTEKALFRLGLR